MRTADELRQALRKFEDTGSAIAIYKEAASYIKQFQEVQRLALDCARAEMETEGVKHHKDDYGSAGWTRPKTHRLDRKRWQQLISRDAQLKALQDEADQVQARLEQAQADAGCMILPEPRFYIR